MQTSWRDLVTIAILCTLPCEAEAVEDLFDQIDDRADSNRDKKEGDTNAYLRGRIAEHHAVLCYLPRKGKLSAGIAASNLLKSYTGVKLALVVGICGGAPSPPIYKEIFLGDVVISDSVVEYDFGKQYPGGFQRETGIKSTLSRQFLEVSSLLNAFRGDNGCSDLQNKAQACYDILYQKKKEQVAPSRGR